MSLLYHINKIRNFYHAKVEEYKLEGFVKIQKPIIILIMQ